ncbi:class I SAM-dependent methyltransferase [Polymorphobacter sp.]|uniref:class I SAM-dependent methyltransferase n=1 Tax=Polymorphobacter sp. TaxID=1909290 RepID=UPI003F71EC97
MILSLLAAAALAVPEARLALPRPDRQIARIVSPHWDDEAARDRAGEADAVIRIVGIKPGQTVADIGAGAGYYTVRLSPLVGPQGRVIAQDIVPRYLRDLRVRIRKAGLTNISFVQGRAADPRLPLASLDAALLIHMYHEIDQPYALLWRLRKSLKPDGRIAIVDLERDSQYHGMPRALLVCEVKAVGYELVSITDLKQGYLAVFRPGPEKDPKTVKACRS